MADRLEQLRLVSLALAKNIEGWKERYVAQDLQEALQRNPRIKLVKGFRGLGKTTALLQVFMKTKDAFYFSADHPIVQEAGIYPISKEALSNGHSTLFIDEIHTHPKWKAELKALHDEFPKLRIVASGSSPLALIPERREEVLEVNPMDLNETLWIGQGRHVEAADEWMEKESTMRLIAANSGIEADYNHYVRYQAFPCAIGMDEERALQAIYNSIRKSVREDAVFFLNMSKEKIFGMENLLNFLATAPPGELSVTALSNWLGLSKTTVYELINGLEAMEIVRIIRPQKKGTVRERAEPKLLFTHPNFRFALCKQLGKEAHLGAIREELAVFGLVHRGWKIHTIKGRKRSPDYTIEKGAEKYIIEIGGEGKKRLQLKGFERGVTIGPYQLIAISLVAKKSKKS